jgi:putative MATE family efflux protein
MKKSRLDEFIASPHRALILLSLPVIASAIVETLYTITDAVFVGRLGADALAAITFAWPFFFVLTALSLGLNAGIASRISRYLGERNRKQAENTMIHGLLMAVLMSFVIAAVGIPLLSTILGLTGATGIVLQWSVNYMLIILAGILFMFVSYAITSIFAAQGDTKTAMKIDIYSLVLNVILSPLFIFVFHLGVSGSALATTVAVTFAFVQSLYFMRKRSYLTLHWKSFKYSPFILKEIVFVGFPSTIMMLTASLSAIFLNRAMITFSVEHVAALGLMSRLESLSILPVYGLSVGAMTLAGMFYGAKKYKLLENVSWYALKITVIVSAAVGLIIFLFPEMFLRMFTDDMAVVAVGIPYVRLYVLAIPFGALSMVIGRILQGIGLGVPGLIISIVRTLVIAVPLAYVFVFVLGYGYLSIATAMIIGSVLSTVMGGIWMGVKERRLAHLAG